MRAAQGLEPLPYRLLRPHGGSGARGMLAAALDTFPDQPHYDALRDDFHARYQACMLRQTTWIDGSAELLDALDRAGVPWGVVTNKALRFAEPQARALGLWHRSAALVAGDSTPHTKPHPAPLLEAARRLRLAARDCAYVGDDPRDVRAGRAAGMATLAAAWGYLGAAAPVGDWGADFVLEHPRELLTWLDLP
jgi:phosphoglycolate phosphatase